MISEAEDFPEKDTLFRFGEWAIMGDNLSNIWSRRLALQSSCIGHKCREFSVPQFLDEVDAVQGKCWWCKAVVPKEIIAVWVFMNADNMPKIRQLASLSDDVEETDNE
jgi:hypothetical protein